MLAGFQIGHEGVVRGTTDNMSLALPALPKVCFISHSYKDNLPLAKLLGRLPSAIEPVVFDPVEVAPTAYVSDELVSGIMGCDGLIFIKGGQSAQSFWTVFERDLALRNRKKVFCYDPATDRIEPYEVPPSKLRLTYLKQERDNDDADKVMRWLADKRSFGLGLEHPDRVEKMQDLELWLQPPEKLFPALQREYTQTIDAGGYLLVFLSENTVSGDFPLVEVPDYAQHRLETTFFVWLHRRANIRLSGDFSVLGELPADNMFEFDTRPTASNFDHRRLDDLMVRLYWLIYRNNGLV
jgi:hypothetical protein